ncbi:hypothetical protein J437_LFUL011136 [Ladona fulva]|uniref:Uncharacterized protein n=1 Tax=Ladona fulva TaxID=123851 RepID=A0A8K0K8R9_LADFU|nr:hypothetical protein J437_LFUL011136 [Ladona fulva]
MATRIIIEQVSQLSELQEIQVTVRESFKGGIIIGGAATAGSLLMGPVGLLVGGVIGSVMTTASAWGKYKSLVVVIMNDLTPKQQEQLVQALQEALNQVNKEDLLKLLMLISAGGAQMAIKDIVLCTVKDYAVKELGMRIR